MTDPLVLQHGLNIKADQALALKLDTTGVEDAYLDLHVGDGSIGRYGSFYVGANGTNAALNATLYAAGTSAPFLDAILATQYEATGGTGAKSKVTVRAGVGSSCTDSGVHSEVYLESVNQSQGSAKGNSLVYIRAANNSTDNAVADSAVFINTPGHVDIEAYGFEASYVKVNAGVDDKNVRMWFGDYAGNQEALLLPVYVGGSVDGSAHASMTATNNSDGLTNPAYGAYSSIRSTVSGNVVLPDVPANILIRSENFSAAPVPYFPGYSTIQIHAQNGSTSADDYRSVDYSVLELKSDAQINLNAIEDFGFITIQGGNSTGSEYAMTQVDIGMIQNGSGGTGPALFSVLASTNYGGTPGVGNHPTAVQLDASYGGHLDCAITKNFTVASYARLSSHVFNGPPSAQQAITEVSSINGQVISGSVSMAKISAIGGYDPYSEDALVWLLSDGVIRSDSQYYTKVDGVYFVPGGSDTTTDPRRYAFQELMLYLWGISGDKAARVFLGPGYHNVNRPDTSPVQMGAVNVIGASNWWSDGGTSIIYFESLDNDSYISMNYGSTIEACHFEASGAMVNHVHAIRMSGQDNVIRNCTFLHINPSSATGTSTGDGSVIWAWQADSGVVEGCKFIGDAGRHAIAVYNTDNFAIRGNYIGNTSTGVDYIDSAIWIDSDISNRSSYLKISDNFVHLGNANNFQQFLYVDDYVQRCSIINNTVVLETLTVSGVANFVRFYGTNASEGDNGYHLVSGNHVIAHQASADLATYGLIRLEWNPNVTISGNNFEVSYWGYTNYATALISLPGAPSENIKIVNNNFDAEDCTAFFASGSSDHYGYVISGNTFKGCRGSIAGGALLSRVGTIRFGGGGCSGMIVSGNTLDFNNDDVSNTAVNCAIVQTSGALFTDCTISNNIFRKSNPGGAINHYALNLDDYTACALNGNVTITGTNLFIGTSASSAYGDDGSGTPNGDTNI